MSRHYKQSTFTWNWTAIGAIGTMLAAGFAADDGADGGSCETVCGRPESCLHIRLQDDNGADRGPVSFGQLQKSAGIKADHRRGGCFDSLQDQARMTRGRFDHASIVREKEQGQS